MTNSKRKTTRIDMHVHTKGSDGHGSPADFVKAVMQAGLHGIALTDHHRTYTKESNAVAKALQAAGILVIRGCEYSTKQGHCLIYGVDVETLKLGMYPDMQETIVKVYEAGGVAFPSHPYKGYKYKLGNDIDGLACWHAETVNGQNQARSPQYDTEAKAAAKRNELFEIGGSDAHWTEDIGLAYTEFEGVIEDDGDFLLAMLDGKVKAKRNLKRIEEARRIRRSWVTQATSKTTASRNWPRSTSYSYSYSSTPKPQGDWRRNVYGSGPSYDAFESDEVGARRIPRSNVVRFSGRSTSPLMQPSPADPKAPVEVPPWDDDAYQSEAEAEIEPSPALAPEIQVWTDAFFPADDAEDAHDAAALARADADLDIGISWEEEAGSSWHYEEEDVEEEDEEGVEVLTSDQLSFFEEAEAINAALEAQAREVKQQQKAERKAARKPKRNRSRSRRNRRSR